MTDREAMKMALEAMGFVWADTVCKNSHHQEKDQHGEEAVCPVEKRWINAYECLRQALAQPEPPFQLTDAGADTNIPLWGLEPKGSGMVTLNQVGMRVNLKDGTRKEWVGLTDDVLNSLVEKCAKYYGYEMKPIQTAGLYALVNAITTKLKESNR